MTKIDVVNSVHSRNFFDLPCRLDWSSFRCVLVNSEMSSILVVIRNVIRKNRSEMIFIHNDNMIQAFTLYTPDYAIDLFPPTPAVNQMTQRSISDSAPFS